MVVEKTTYVEKTLYVICCNTCGKEHDPQFTESAESYEDALNEAEDDGWIETSDDRHLCPGCQEDDDCPEEEEE